MNGRWKGLAPFVVSIFVASFIQSMTTRIYLICIGLVATGALSAYLIAKEK